jgi:hypothetical protein
MATVNKDFEIKNGLRALSGSFTANSTAFQTTLPATLSSTLATTGAATFANTATFNGSLVTVNSPQIYVNATQQGVVGLGTIAAAGTLALNYNAGNIFTATMSGAATWNLTNLPASNVYWEVQVVVTNPAAGAITFQRAGSALTVNWIKGDGTQSTTFSNMGVTLQGSGVTNHFLFWGTISGGTVYGRAM